MLEPVRPEAVFPDRALCLPTFSHFLIVNKTSLSLSLFYEKDLYTCISQGKINRCLPFWTVQLIEHGKRMGCITEIHCN